MKRNTLMAIMLLACAILAAPARATISFTPQATAVPGSAPQGFSYQGRLENSGAPVNGPTLMVFRIYDNSVGGNLIWQSNGITAQVALGLFTVVVPSPLTSLIGGGGRWLEVQINGNIMSPREQLTSVPYALIAKSVEGIIDVSTSGLSIMPNALATNPALIISSQTGNVGIGTQNPAAAFSVGASSLVVTSGGAVGVGTNNPSGSFSVGTSSLVVTSGGSVGVNVASPAANLDVNGNAQFGSGATKSTFTLTGALLLANSNTIRGGYGAIPANPNSMVLGAGGGFPNAASVAFGSSGAGWLYSVGTQNLGLFSPILNVADTGSVGVGTQGPLSKLDVSGNAAIGTYAGASAAPANGLIVSGAAGVGTAGPLSKFDVAGGAAFGTYAGANAAPANGLIVSGRVGVGTSGPLSAMDVAGGSAHGAYAGANAAPANGLIVSGATGVGTASPQSKFDVSGNASLGTYGGSNAAPANGLIVSGASGVGTAGPQSKFDVNGNVSLGAYGGANAAPANGLIVSGSVGVGTALPLSKFDVNGAAALGAYAGSVAGPANGLIVSGNAGFGTSAPAAQLDVNGVAQFGSGVNKSTFSAAGGLTFANGYNPAGAQDATTKNYVDSQLLSGGGPWTQNSPSIFPTTQANNVTIFSTLTVQGASFSVGAANLSVKAGGVGIGTAGQLSKLDVAGGVAVGGYAGVSAAPASGLIVSGSAGVATAAPKSSFDVAGSVSLGAYGGVTAAPANGLIVSGNVGIGATTPNTAGFTSASVLTIGGGVNRGILELQTGSVGASKVQFNNALAGGESYNVGAAQSANGNFDIYDATLNQPRLTINSVGSVGVGTTVPAAALHVSTASGGGVGGANPIPSSLIEEKATVGSGQYNTLQLYESGNTALGSGTMLSLASKGADGNRWTYAGVGHAMENTTIAGGAPTGSLLFFTGNGTTVGEKMRITGAGNVGIGTTSPAAALDVNGVGRFMGSGAPTTGKGLEIGYNAGANIGVITSYDRSATAWKRLDIDGLPINLNSSSGGNVGIGTASPSSRLTVSDGNILFNIPSTSPNPSAVITWPSSSPNFRLTNISAVESVNVNSAGNTFFNGGNVGIGTTTPQATIDSVGTASGAGVGINLMTTAQIQASTPLRVGVLVYNTTLGGTAGVCVSTGTTVQSYARLVAGTSCQ